MIRYRMQCANAHDFEAWFASSTAFEEQRAAGRLACPVCSSADVDRALMAPAVRRAGGETARQPGRPAPPADAADQAPAPGAADPKAAAVLTMMRALHRKVREHGVDVGRTFPEEARKIHYGEADPRPIYGEANVEEAQSLVEEGVEILPLPPLPEDHN